MDANATCAIRSDQPRMRFELADFDISFGVGQQYALPGNNDKYLNDALKAFDPSTVWAKDPEMQAWMRKFAEESKKTKDAYHLRAAIENNFIDGLEAQHQRPQTPEPWRDIQVAKPQTCQINADGKLECHDETYEERLGRYPLEALQYWSQYKRTVITGMVYLTIVGMNVYLVIKHLWPLNPPPAPAPLPMLPIAFAPAPLPILPAAFAPAPLPIPIVPMALQQRPFPERER